MSVVSTQSTWGHTSDLIRLDIQNIQDEIRTRSLHAFRCCLSLQSLPHHRMQRTNFRNSRTKEVRFRLRLKMLQNRTKAIHPSQMLRSSIDDQTRIPRCHRPMQIISNVELVNS